MYEKKILKEPIGYMVTIMSKLAIHSDNFNLSTHHWCCDA